MAIHPDELPIGSIIDLNEIRDPKRLYRPSHVWTPQRMEFMVEKLLRSVRFHRGDVLPKEPIDILKMCGFGVEMVEGLEEHIGEFGLTKTAGILDWNERVVVLARNFHPNTIRFTAAHELAHLLLHRPMTPLHRDRGVDGSKTLRRTPMEAEADKCAALILMPKEEVVAEVLRRFRLVPFPLTDETAFALYGANRWDVRHRWETPRDGAMELATATHFDRNHFSKTLCERFGVSPVAMAIRLEELGLIGGF